MKGYVIALIASLNDCFDTSRRQIRILQDVDPILVDISQAVPLVLILNKAITNSIKYAFNDRGGEIKISLKIVKNNNLKLKVNDNGKGFPENFDVNNLNSA
jgi:two-component sensor histidine kinase